MASFRVHISFGVALGAAAAVASTTFGLVPSGDVSVHVLLALAIIIGSVLPDIDSDSGLPFNVSFGALTILAGGLSALSAWRNEPHDSWVMYATPVIVVAFTWFVIGGMFKKWTIHRGMAHSIPAALISGLGVFFLLTHGGYVEWDAFLVGIAMVAGYLLHLVLDEIHSVVNFHGVPFIPNKSLGSALKFVSKSHGANAAVYGLLICAVGSNYEKFSSLLGELIGKVGK